MKLFRITFLISLCLLVSTLCFAQSESFDINQLSQQLGIPTQDFVVVTIAGNPRLTQAQEVGSQTTQTSHKPRIVLVEFSDVNCGYCIRFHKNTLNGIVHAFVDSGKIDYVYKDYVSIGGQDSEDVALALRCLHADVGNDIYFDVLEKLYRSPGRYGLKRLFDIMIANLVDTQMLSESSIASIRDCIQTKQFFDAFSIERMEAQSIGVVGTPVYVLGVENQEGRVEGIFLPGYLQFETLAGHVEAMLPLME